MTDLESDVFRRDYGPTGPNDTIRSSAITDHPYVPRRWYAYVCKVCGLAEAAHVETTVVKEASK